MAENGWTFQKLLEMAGNFAGKGWNGWNYWKLLGMPGHDWKGQQRIEKGHPPSADLRYGDEDTISPSTLIFAARKS